MKELFGDMREGHAVAQRETLAKLEEISQRLAVLVSQQGRERRDWWMICQPYHTYPSVEFIHYMSDKPVQSLPGEVIYIYTSGIYHNVIHYIATYSCDG
jgi:hypothetical protein